MNRLPNELLDRICSFLERRDLRAIIQVSTRFRSLAILPFLSRFGISQSDLQSGTLSLSDSFFLILVVAQLRPIQRLVCFNEHVPGSQLRYKRLATILAVTAPIPDIVVYNRQYMLTKTRRETVHLLSCIPQATTSTFVIVKGSSTCLSHPRSAPPIRWKLLPPPLGPSTHHLPTAMKVLLIVFGIPLLFAYLVSGIINCGVLVMWAYRRLFGPAWPHADRITTDAGFLVFDDWMRVQTLPGRLTLVTLTEARSRVLVLKPLPALATDAYSTILSSLDLGHYLVNLRIDTDADLVLTDLITFLQRHPHLTHLWVQPNALHPSSLRVTALPIPRNPESRILLITAPAAYIPFLLPAAPNLERISLPFLPAPKRLPSTTAFDLPAYSSALEALAALPGTHPLTLTLAFRLTAAALPWRMPPSDSPPEAQLARVSELALSTDGSARFRAPAIRALTPWLTLFPGLRRVSFAHGAVERIPVAERTLLAQAICAACSGISSTQDVAFNILDD